MTLDEIILRFRNDLIKTYGPVAEKELLTINFGYELFDLAMIDMYQKSAAKFHYSPSSMNDMRVCGVKINARHKDIAE